MECRWSSSRWKKDFPRQPRHQAARLIALLAQAKQFTSSRVYRTACPPLPERIATGLSSLRWSSRLGLLTAVAVEIFMNNAG